MSKKKKHSPAPIKKGGHTATGIKTNRNGLGIKINTLKSSYS